MAEENEIVEEDEAEPVADENEEAEVAEPESPEPEVQEPEAKGSRANEAIRAARERAQAAERLAQDHAAELARERAARQAAEEAAKRKEEQDEKDLPYDERLYRYAQRRDQEVNARLAQSEARIGDQVDKAAYEAKASLNPTYKKYQAKVEEHLANLRKTGANAPREGILKYLVGEDALAPKAAASASKQKAAATARVQAARGQPVGARSDASGKAAAKSESEAREARLEGVIL